MLITFDFVIKIHRVRKKEREGVNYARGRRSTISSKE